MRSEVLLLALITGACTWAFRYLPLRLDLSDLKPDSVLSRFLAATGPAAIAALFVAEVMPYLRQPLAGQAPLVLGTVAVLAAFAASRSAVLATVAGAVVFGVVTALT